MKIVLTGEQTHQTRFVADNCSYVIPQEEHCVLCSNFHEAIGYIPSQNRILDPVALLSLLVYGYVCGDRTMVRGLKRIPLHSVINSQGEILRQRQLPHGCGLARQSSRLDLSQRTLMMPASLVRNSN